MTFILINRGFVGRAIRRRLLGQNETAEDTETEDRRQELAAENVASGFFDRQYRPRWSSSERPPPPREIDALRGLAIVLMALDHTRDYFGDHSIDALDLAHTNFTLFLARWLTFLRNQRSSASLA